jgi:hypothetical protein
MRSGLVVLALVVLASLAVPAAADPLTIVNAGFDSPSLTDGTAQTDFSLIPGWSKSSATVGAGVMNPSTTQTTGGMDFQGSTTGNVLYNDDGSEKAVYQTLTETWQAGTYTVTRASPGSGPGRWRKNSRLRHPA